eukprot:TRINITY_DN5185_c0_g1_i2.p1 TRINITY_DN5185_c0_g1~~TRINITY_DN5185_c0_g1_i2.p1  ORF type:complete len:179 (-),score=34.79 TRINITY_DN5185_c0_g1_i2:330-866(-)
MRGPDIPPVARATTVNLTTTELRTTAEGETTIPSPQVITTVHSTTVVVSTSCSHCQVNQSPSVKLSLQENGFHSGSYTCASCHEKNRIMVKLDDHLGMESTAEIPTRQYAPSVAERKNFSTQIEAQQYYENEMKKTKPATNEAENNSTDGDTLRMMVMTTCGNPTCKLSLQMELVFVS